MQWVWRFAKLRPATHFISPDRKLWLMFQYLFIFHASPSFWNPPSFPGFCGFLFVLQNWVQTKCQLSSKKLSWPHNCPNLIYIEVFCHSPKCYKCHSDHLTLPSLEKFLKAIFICEESHLIQSFPAWTWHSTWFSQKKVIRSTCLHACTTSLCLNFLICKRV